MSTDSTPTAAPAAGAENRVERETVRLSKAERDALEQVVEDGHYPNKSEAFRAGLRAVLDTHLDADETAEVEPEALIDPSQPAHAPAGPVELERVDVGSRGVVAGYRVGTVNVLASAPLHAPRDELLTALPHNVGRHVAEARAVRQTIIRRESAATGPKYEANIDAADPLAGRDPTNPHQDGDSP